MRYALLLRGVNVGGKNAVSMKELKDRMAGLGLENVQSYINSGNLFFDSALPESDCQGVIKRALEHYDFDIPFVLFDECYYQNLLENLPEWWSSPMARRDVLFVTEGCGFQEMKECLLSMQLHNELVHFAHNTVFWGKIDEREFLKTAYHKELIKMPFYKQITIRNGKTFDMLGVFLQRA